MPRADRGARPTAGSVLAALLAAVVLGSVFGWVAAAGAAPSQAEGVSRAEAAALARRAVTDDGALAELRAIEVVDGEGVDLAAVLDGVAADRSDQGSRAERLTALASALDSGSAAADPDPAASREVARRVLDDDKFQEDRVPRPFRGLLTWIADRLRPAGDLLERLVRPILDLPGGPFVLGAMLMVVGAVAVAWLSGRRSRAAVAREASGALVDPSLDPAELDRRAGAAEAAGDLGAAIRLRYQAGLLRLARDGRLELRADTTASEAARQVDLPGLHRITATFEAVAYGGRQPSVQQVQQARVDWAEVLGAGSRR